MNTNALYHSKVGRFSVEPTSRRVSMEMQRASASYSSTGNSQSRAISFTGSGSTAAQKRIMALKLHNSLTYHGGCPCSTTDYGRRHGGKESQVLQDGSTVLVRTNGNNGKMAAGLRPLSTINKDPTLTQRWRLCRHGSLLQWSNNRNVNALMAKVNGFGPFGSNMAPASIGSLSTSLSAREHRPIGAGFYRARMTKRKVNRRLVMKNGDCNVSHENVPKQKQQYLRDIFTTLIDIKWRWCLLIFAAGFLLSWTLFAIIFYLICLAHGDFKHFGEPNWTPCVAQVNSFTTSFLFSLESQHTIGYGHRYTTHQCPEAVLIMCLQCICGVMIQSFMAGVVFAKIARPKKRAETLIFSKTAVVCMRDENLCLLFRVGDMRKSHIVEAHVRLQMIKKRVTSENEFLPLHQYDMNVGYDSGLDRIFLVWPLTICHVIDATSPLYEYAAEDLSSAQFEIVAILEGIVESTGMTTQARTSYLPHEIMWGYRFEKLVTYQRENGQYRCDYARFHNVIPKNTPSCSAKDLDDLREAGFDPEEEFGLKKSSSACAAATKHEDEPMVETEEPITFVAAPGLKEPLLAEEKRSVQYTGEVPIIVEIEKPEIIEISDMNSSGEGEGTDEDLAVAETESRRASKESQKLLQKETLALPGLLSPDIRLRKPSGPAAIPISSRQSQRTMERRLSEVRTPSQVLRETDIM